MVGTARPPADDSGYLDLVATANEAGVSLHALGSVAARVAVDSDRWPPWRLRMAVRPLCRVGQP
jgi:hypothetical protein